MSKIHRRTLPPIPAKRYFTISEAGQLCDIKPHVLRYWEQEFSQLSPVKRQGGRRYYQEKDIVLIRRIRELLYIKGFTIIGAKQALSSRKPMPELEESVVVETVDVETSSIDKPMAVEQEVNVKSIKVEAQPQGAVDKNKKTSYSAIKLILSDVIEDVESFLHRLQETNV